MALAHIENSECLSPLKPTPPPFCLFRRGGLRLPYPPFLWGSPYCVSTPPSLRVAIALFIPLFLFLSASDPSLSLPPTSFVFQFFWFIIYLTFFSLNLCYFFNSFFCSYKTKKKNKNYLFYLFFF